MKKKVSILITITLILNIVLQVFGNLSFAVITNQTEEKKHPESYWSTQNAPMFYGATKITLQKGIIDKFEVLDARFRIFAKDFEDGDLTPYITHSGEVKLDEVGKHEITYTVTDSHKNKTTLVVPVIVTEEEDTKIKVERTIYTTPSVWNMDLAEFSRCNYGDRQILGVYLSNNQSIKARIVSSESALAVNFFNNDQYTESSMTIPVTGEWVTLENRKQTVMSGEGMDRKYGLVSNEVLQKYTTQGDMNLQIEIDDMRQIQGKVIQIKDGKDIIKSIKIESNQIEETLPIGTYFLQMPVINGYSYQYAYVQIKEDMENAHTYVYEKLEDIDYDNYLMFRVLGYNYDTIAYQLTFKEQYTKAEIRYPNQSAMSGNEYVKIYDTKGDIVTEDIATGGYFDFNKGTHEITLEPGYVIEICYPNKYANKVVVYNTLTNTIIPEYKAIDTVTRYTIIENGIVREDISEENAEDVAYAQLKVHLVSIIEAYKQKVTEEELQNKRINYEEKTQIIDAYNQLREQDKIPYTSLINKIKQGGIPKITVIAPTLEFEKGTPIDVYTFIKAFDNEDGVIVIDKNSTVVKTNLKHDEVGRYFVTYEVSDSDNNVATKTIEITIIGEIEVPEIPDEGEEEKPVLPPNPDEEDKEEIPPTEEGGEDNTNPPTEPDEEDKEDGENEEITPPEDNEEDKEEGEIVPPEKNEEDEGNKEEGTVPGENQNTGNVGNSGNSSSGNVGNGNASSNNNSNDNVEGTLNNEQENLSQEAIMENDTEIEALNEEENRDMENFLEEEVIESIQGDYVDELGENIENDEVQTLLNTKENQYVVVKIFSALAVIGIVAFGIVRKIKKDKK